MKSKVLSCIRCATTHGIVRVIMSKHNGQQDRSTMIDLDGVSAQFQDARYKGRGMRVHNLSPDRAKVPGAKQKARCTICASVREA